jgi:hypothetical protein
MTTDDNQKLAIISNNFKCIYCNYTTIRKYNFNIHLQSIRHQNNKNNAFSAKLSKHYTCQNCGKEYKDRAGLWRHNNKGNCIITPNNTEQIKTEQIKTEQIKTEQIKTDISFDKEFMLMIINQNKELLEIVKNGTHNTNSHNKAFNLNFFLNETCKNAMNITDFVDSIKLQLNDLMDVGELGFVEGISKIIVKNLNNLDEDIRPVHCTDKKRETFYVKDKDTWTKEDDNKTKLRKVVKTIANKNIRMLSQFREKYPEYNNSSSKISDTHDKLVIEAMTSDDVEDEKIIKNISKVTTIREK